jgi:hypothetical protein
MMSALMTIAILIDPLRKFSHFVKFCGGCVLCSGCLNDLPIPSHQPHHIIMPPVFTFVTRREPPVAPVRIFSWDIYRCGYWHIVCIFAFLRRMHHHDSEHCCVYKYSVDIEARTTSLVSAYNHSRITTRKQ